MRQLLNSTFLAQGGMGTVREGTLEDQTTPAIEKTARKDLLHLHSVRDGFAFEIAACTQLSPFHWRFPQVFPDYTDENKLCMEKIEGTNLRRYLNENGGLSLQETLNIGIQLCEALALMYGSGEIVHRDIKHDNIMISKTPNGLEIKLIDFGLACCKNAPRLYNSGSVGSPSYKAPEGSNNNSNPHDCRFDLYSLGVILTEAFNGNRLFPPGAPRPEADRMWKINRLPTGLREIVIKLLQKDKNDRYQTASEAGKDIAALALKSDPTLERKYPFNIFLGRTAQQIPRPVKPPIQELQFPIFLGRPNIQEVQFPPKFPKIEFPDTSPVKPSN